VADSVHAYATAARRRRRRHQPSTEALNDGDEQQQQQQQQQVGPHQHTDDIVDISYVGASIPSRTFRVLQQAVGVTAPQGR